MLMDLKLW